MGRGLPVRGEGCTARQAKGGRGAPVELSDIEKPAK